MKVFAALSLVIIASTSVFAANMKGYGLDMDLSMDGKHVTSKKLRVLDGQNAVITQEAEDGEKIFMDVTATEHTFNDKKQPAILMRFKIGKISKETGEKIILTTPQITANENEEAAITVGEGENEISLTVKATRKAL